MDRCKFSSLFIELLREDLMCADPAVGAQQLGQAIDQLSDGFRAQIEYRNEPIHDAKQT